MRAHWSREDLKDAFCPHDEAWKQTLISRGHALYEVALADLTARRHVATDARSHR